MMMMADVIISDNGKVTDGDDDDNSHGVFRVLVLVVVVAVVMISTMVMVGVLVMVVRLMTEIEWKCHRCFGVVLSVSINVRLVMVTFCFDRGSMLASW